MWDFFETVHRRHSVRKYHTDMPVEREKLHAILATACAAPSAGDLQPYRIVVVTDTGTRGALRRAAHDQPFITEAPVCLVFCCDRERSAERFGERGRSLYAVQDTTIAAAYAQLAVVAAGMASTWVGQFDMEETARVLGLAPPLEPVAMLSLGYPAELPEPTPRRRMDEVVEWRSQAPEKR
ncbi:MAG: nitroreductase [Gammaproteobacteria bacterium]|nr:nitroreductase [Gammaproteobacteria bacterium]NIR97793.1 nitroreductase [Gammaproteobacteria bacterium]NIT63493.1 nitroreductase [Gammaproteobacteria bacterium]NIV20440.1 nitroreductase [Gammaproteobacteria bacterium]NIX11022.1 nitroreductase [Gammaproteobacteria bacterium]